MIGDGGIGGAGFGWRGGRLGGIGGVLMGNGGGRRRLCRRERRQRWPGVVVRQRCRGWGRRCWRCRWTDRLSGLFIGTGTTPSPAPAAAISRSNIDFVRHGQTNSNASDIIDTAIPGAPLNAMGQQQANAIANVLNSQGPFAGIFDSQLIRTQQTALPLETLTGLTAQLLAGLNEINAGILEGMPQIPAGFLYIVGPIAWTHGLPLVAMLAPGSTNPNGVFFYQGFNNALETMYDAALANPVVAANGQITDVAYSSELAIEAGTLMSVNNPEPLLMFTHPLPNTGVVVVDGSPQGGWTMESWDGDTRPAGVLGYPAVRRCT